MAKRTKINMKYRPKSYWVFRNMKEKLAATVKGDARRLLAENAIDGVIPYESRNFEESLANAERKAWGAHHPQLMGGEYLPDLDRSEVEIVRVSLESTTGDVISIRARWRKGAIHYSIVDEYISKYSFSPRASEKPLTMGEIIGLMDSVTMKAYDGLLNKPCSGLIIPILQYNFETEPMALPGLKYFVRVSSPFYPDLSEWYRAVCDEWYNKTLFKSFLEELEEQMLLSGEGSCESLSASFQRALFEFCQTHDLSPEQFVNRFGVPKGKRCAWVRDT